MPHPSLWLLWLLLLLLLALCGPVYALYILPHRRAGIALLPTADPAARTSAVAAPRLRPRQEERLRPAPPPVRSLPPGPVLPRHYRAAFAGWGGARVDTDDDATPLLYVFDATSTCAPFPPSPPPRARASSISKAGLKTMKNQALIQEVIAQISQRFAPKIPGVFFGGWGWDVGFVDRAVTSASCCALGVAACYMNWARVFAAFVDETSAPFRGAIGVAGGLSLRWALRRTTHVFGGFPARRGGSRRNIVHAKFGNVLNADVTPVVYAPSSSSRSAPPVVAGGSVKQARSRHCRRARMPVVVGGSAKRAFCAASDAVDVDVRQTACFSLGGLLGVSPLRFLPHELGADVPCASMRTGSAHRLGRARQARETLLEEYIERVDGSKDTFAYVT
ncbi:hypothetical protein C8J57DRAFT_1260258 [Mycena rebaudengoi]|nr:hypothetical protein C8J57DRAFT_1260258 [Mycena rebaudengoi]